MSEDSRMRLLLVDDHPVVRAGFAALLGDEPDLVVVGQTGDGLEALELVDQLAPDLVVLDLMLPGLSGLEVNRRIAGRTRVLVLTLHANEAYATQVLADGAAGFVLKDAHPTEIVRAVRRIRAGERHVPLLLGRGREPEDPWSLLTAREKEVAQLVGEGRSHADIGERLGISKRTVEVHRGNAMRKLRLSGAPELVRFLVRRGILSSVD